MDNRQIDRKTSKQVRIDSDLHRLLKIKAASEKNTLKALIETILSESVGYTPITLPKDE